MMLAYQDFPNYLRLAWPLIRPRLNRLIFLTKRVWLTTALVLHTKAIYDHGSNHFVHFTVIFHQSKKIISATLNMDIPKKFELHGTLVLRHLAYSRTPDRDFRCFYPCEIFLSHTPLPALGKDKTNSRTLASRRSVTSL